MIQDHILKLFTVTDKKISNQMVLSKLSSLYSKKNIQQKIRELIENNTLMYVQQFGSTYIEKSFNRPVRVSQRVVLKPPGISYEKKTGEIVVNLDQGCSFGSGSHPTSRLSILAIEYLVMHNLMDHIENSKRISLDIGTGTGILALVTAMFGLSEVTAIDIDPYSLFECKRNVELNHMSDVIKINSDDLKKITGLYSLITANLRYPTLKDMCLMVSDLLEQGGLIVLSGFRKSEYTGLKNYYQKNQFKVIKTYCELDWMSVVFKKTITSVV